MRQHYGLLLLGFFFMLVQNYSYLEVPRYIKLMLDEIGGLNRWPVIRSSIIYALLYTAVLAVSMFLMRKLIISVSRKIEYQLRENIFNKLLSLDYFFFRQNETGDLISRSTNDLNHVRTLLGPGIMYVPNSLTRMILFLPVLIGISGKLMLVLGILMVVLVAVIFILLPMMRPLFKQIQVAMGEMNNRVWQVLSGISTIKHYTAEKIETERFKDLNEDYVKKQMDVVKVQGGLRPFFFYLFSLTEMIILWVGGNQVIAKQITMGELLQFNIMIAQLAFPILSLAWIMTMVQQGATAMSRINEILDWKIDDGNEKVPLESNGPEITVTNLNYAFPDDDENTLKNINLKVSPGEIIGITGPVGSGKSTLLNILTGLMKPKPGQVFIDGIDMVDIEPASLYDKIAIVAQEPFLFSRTLAENVSLGPHDMPMDTIRRAVEDAGLKQDIESFPQGYDQEIGERGITLSGGQKQRTAIARALAKCSPLLVFDDPLSNVDARTEARILGNLKDIKCFKTLIIVSHRVSVLKEADRIYVLDDGVITEEGCHAELVTNGGLYTRLARMQQMEMELEDE